MTTNSTTNKRCEVLDAALDSAQELHGFTVKARERLTEIEGTAYVMEHKASGAHLLFLSNEDTNKAFSIAFRTPPENDTGVFLILEHSVHQREGSSQPHGCVSGCGVPSSDLPQPSHL